MSDFFFGYEETELLRTGTAKRGPWYLAHFLSKHARLPAKSFCGVRVVEEINEHVHPGICKRCLRVVGAVTRKMQVVA